MRMLKELFFRFSLHLYSNNLERSLNLVRLHSYKSQIRLLPHFETHISSISLAILTFSPAMLPRPTPGIETRGIHIKAHFPRRRLQGQLRGFRVCDQKISSKFREGHKCRYCQQPFDKMLYLWDWSVSRKVNLSESRQSADADIALSAGHNRKKSADSEFHIAIGRWIKRGTDPDHPQQPYREDHYLIPEKKFFIRMH